MALMRKRASRSEPVGWFPVDSRIFAPFLSFSHVRGVARLFLIVEMALAVMMVIGSMTLTVLSFF